MKAEIEKDQDTPFVPFTVKIHVENNWDRNALLRILDPGNAVIPRDREIARVLFEMIDKEG